VSSTIHITGDGASQQRADELNNSSGAFFKTRKLANGVKISFDIKYKYTKDFKSEDLKLGDNVLNFVSKSTSADKQDRSHIIGYELHAGDPSTKRTGRYGMIYKDNWDDTHTIFHESLHFTGLSDRYFGYGSPEGKNAMEGFENDIMGSGDNIGYDHYQNYYNRATSPQMIKKYPSGSFINRVPVDRDSRGYLIAPSKRQIDEQNK
jgi:hypothetical protein